MNSNDLLPDTVTLIGFIGCDGTGTSTHAEHTTEFLREQGYNVEEVWMRFEHRYALPLLASARLLGLSETHEAETGHKASSHSFERRDWIGDLYEWALLKDQRRMVNRTLNAIEPGTDVVIADRCILDALVDLAVSTDDPSRLQNDTASEFWKLVPQQTDIIGLECDAETIANRRPDVATDPALEDRVKYYSQLYEDPRITSFDTSQPLSSVKNDISQHVTNVLENRS